MLLCVHFRLAAHNNLGGFHMILNQAQFSHFNSRAKSNGQTIIISYYTYESANKMYDVIIAEGQKHYRVNMRPYLAKTAKHAIHTAIEEHYSI